MSSSARRAILFPSVGELLNSLDFRQIILKLELPQDDQLRLGFPSLKNKQNRCCIVDKFLI